MLNRSRAREFAMQVLFLWDTADVDDAAAADSVLPDGLVLDEDTRRRGLEMAQAAWDMRKTADAWVARLAPQWPPHRQPGVDRSILRLSIWELTSGQTPPKVVIDEAVEMAKTFSTAQSPSFVNAVLDSVLKEVQQLSGKTP